MDSSLLLSLCPGVDLFCPPRKGARVSAPFLFRGANPQEQACSIDALPDECLYEILRRLPGREERSVSACVSKRWLMLLASIPISEFTDSDWRDNEDKGWDILCSDGCLERSLEGKEATDVRLAAITVRTGGRLSKLCIQGSNTTRGVTDVGLTAVARGCPYLRGLLLSDVPLISDEGLSEIANGCPVLESIDLMRCPLISDKGMVAIAQKCLCLFSLSVESCPKFGNDSLQAFAHWSLSLQCISIVHCPLVGDQGVASLVSSASASLMKIELQRLNITDVSLGAIGLYGREVTELVLSDLQNVNERGFWVMGAARGLQNLTSIMVTSCRGLTGLGLESVAKGCPMLKQLCLKRCCSLSDAGLKAFGGAAGCLENMRLEECNSISLIGVLGALFNCNAAKLRTLALVKCMGIKDVISWERHLPACTSLQSLSIRSCPGFSSSCLAMVGKLCPQLRHVDLSGLIGMTDAAVIPLVESCESGLVKVNLSGCVNLTDTVVSTLARVHGGTLQVFNIGGCRNVTDKSLFAIADNCYQIGNLDVSGCGVTDYGIAALSSSRKLNLQTLSLSGCSKISSWSLSLLGNIGQSLVALNLQKCRLISAYDIELLEEKMWWCNILS